MSATQTRRELLDVAAAADYLGTGERFVRRLVSERRIAFVKVGRLVRLDARDLEDFLDAGRVEPVRADVPRTAA